MKLNRFQRAILETYADGDFRHLLDEEMIEDVYNLGDSLLSFILIELSDYEYCEDQTTAIARMEYGQLDLQGVIETLEAMSDTSLSHPA